MGMLRGAMAAVVAIGWMACSDAHAQEKTLVVWDFKSAEPLMKPYFNYVREAFEQAHPGVRVRQIAQPADNFYTVLGTAINAKQGPDVVLLNGGDQAMDRADAFVTLKDQTSDILPDLAGLSAFKRRDGSGYVALPFTVQGNLYYYNKEIYREAGLDPAKPPLTWEDLTSNCEAIKTKTKASCLTLGNKEGTYFTLLVTAVAQGLWPKDTRAKFIAHELPWTSTEVRSVFAKIKEMIDKGWIAKGENSYSAYTDAVNIFAGARTGHLLGLISDAPNSWKNLEDLAGAGEVGVALPVAIGMADKDNPIRLEVDGGIGFAVTSWSQNKDLALDYIKTAASPKAAAKLMEAAGGLPSNAKVDMSQMNSSAGKEVVRLLGCCSEEPRMRTTFVAAERLELQRVGQLLLTGDISVDDALQSIERVRQKELARTK